MCVFFPQNYYFDYMGDAPSTTVQEQNNQCPPPAGNVTDDSCTLPECRSDGDCDKNKERCCYNGCLQTCVLRIEPPVCKLFRIKYMSVFQKLAFFHKNS